MESAIGISNTLLWVAVVCLGVVILALVRQVGVLNTRLAPVGALVTGRGLKEGEAAPVFELTDMAGRPLQVGGDQAEGLHTLLFFLSPSCDVCKTLLPALKSIGRSERSWLRVVLASDGPREQHQRFVEERSLSQFPYLLSADLGMSFQVSHLPYAVLLDGAGIIKAQGLTNSREHIDSLFEASERGVASLQEHFAKQQATQKAARGPQDYHPPQKPLQHHQPPQQQEA